MKNTRKKIKTAAQQKEEALFDLTNAFQDFQVRFEASVYICKETMKRIEQLRKTPTEKEIAEISKYIRETTSWLQWDREGDPFYDSYEAHVQMLDEMAETLLEIVNGKTKA